MSTYYSMPTKEKIYFFWTQLKNLLFLTQNCLTRLEKAKIGETDRKLHFSFKSPLIPIGLIRTMQCKNMSMIFKKNCLLIKIKPSTTFLYICCGHSALQERYCPSFLSFFFGGGVLFFFNKMIYFHLIYLQILINLFKNRN